MKLFCLIFSNSSALRLNCIKIIKKKVPKFSVPSLIVIHRHFDEKVIPANSLFYWLSDILSISGKGKCQNRQPYTGESDS